MGFNRGFKSWAERSSVSIRKELGIKAHDPLAPDQLADHLGIELWSPEQITDLPKQSRDQLLQIDPEGWSGVTIQLGDRALIIYNPRHSLRRQASDKMHELAHILIGHEPAKIVLSQNGAMVMRSYDQKQEDEAVWLAGCLLLPREALLFIARQRLDISGACQLFCVSKQLLIYRMNVTGVSLQIQHLGRKLKNGEYHAGETN